MWAMPEIRKNAGSMDGSETPAKQVDKTFWDPVSGRIIDSWQCLKAYPGFPGVRHVLTTQGICLSEPSGNHALSTTGESYIHIRRCERYSMYPQAITTIKVCICADSNLREAGHFEGEHRAAEDCHCGTSAQRRQRCSGALLPSAFGTGSDRP